jgi:hypothetical protein
VKHAKGANYVPFPKGPNSVTSATQNRAAESEEEQGGRRGKVAPHLGLGERGSPPSPAPPPRRRPPIPTTSSTVPSSWDLFLAPPPRDSRCRDADCFPRGFLPGEQEQACVGGAKWGRNSKKKNSPAGSHRSKSGGRERRRGGVEERNPRRHAPETGRWDGMEAGRCSAGGGLGAPLLQHRTQARARTLTEGGELEW